MKTVLAFLSIFLLPLSALAANPLKVLPQNSDWIISDQEDFYIYATEPVTQTTVVLFTDNLAPVAGGCRYKERTKDIPFEIAVYKKIQANDKRVDRIADLDKVRIYLKNGEQKYSSIKPEQITELSGRDKWARNKDFTRLGKLKFVSPFGCSLLENTVFKLIRLRINQKELPDLEFKVNYRDSVAGGLKPAKHN